MKKMLQFNTPKHYLLGTGLLLVVLFDFISRIYAPAVSGEASLSPLDLASWQAQLAPPQPTELLLAYFKPAASAAATGAAADATAKTVMPLAGSERLGDASYRLRAVLSRRQEGVNHQQALLEQQMLEGKEAGVVRPLLLKVGESLGDYQLAQVGVDSVTLQKDEQQLVLPLFKPSAAQSAAGVASDQPATGAQAPKKTVHDLLKTADPKDAEELKALLELMKNQ